MIGRIALILILLLLDRPALAHTKSESHSDWRIVANRVLVTFTIPEIEARRIASSGEADRSREAEPSSEAVGRYLQSHLASRQNDADCPALSPIHPVSALSGFRRYELSFQCPGAGGITLRSSAFFDLVPSHVTFAQLTDDQGHITEQLFTRDHQILDSSDGDNPLQDAGFLDYIRLGVMHILTGIDHISFLLGLVLISRRFKDLIYVVTGFTLGHSATLALAVTGVLRPHAAYIDALVGLTIALIGAENVSVASRRPGLVALATLLLLGVLALADGIGLVGLPPLLLVGAGLFAANYLRLSGSLGAGNLGDAARLRLVVTLVFGLIHGFGFASDLLEMRLPTDKLAELLVGFNLGVEIGQISLVLAMIAFAAGVVRLGLGLSRRWVVDIGSAALVAFGLFLLGTRSYI